MKTTRISSKKKLFSNLDSIAEEATARLKKKGITEKDFTKIIQKRRKTK